MFFISFPKTFRIGDTADCRINKEPARVTWRDADHLVIEPDDARAILAIDKGAELLSFVCSDADTAREDYQPEMEPSGAGFIISQKPKRKEPRA